MREAQVEAANGQLTLENEGLEQQLGAAQQEMAELRGDNARLAEAKRQLEQENADLKGTEKRLSEQTSGLEREIERRTSELQRDNDRLCEQNRELDSAKSRAVRAPFPVAGAFTMRGAIGTRAQEAELRAAQQARAASDREVRWNYLYLYQQF
eukprot:tig00021318_g20170.t1